jgi:hypothetical protein
MHRYILGIMLTFLAATPVLADGDCPDRPATQQERAAIAAMYGAAKAALPPAPVDWLLKDETDGKLGTTVPACPGGKNDQPVHYRLRFRYAYSSEAAAREDKGVVESALKGTPAQQAKLAELGRKIDELEEQKKTARKSGDAGEKERVKKELKTAEKERDRITDEISEAYVQKAMSGQIAADMSRNKPASREAELIIKANERVAWVPATDQPVSIPGAPIAYWFKSDTGGRLVILLGPWDARKFRAELASTSPVTRAQTLVIEISGDRQMAESLAKQVKIELLKKQL